MAKKNKHKRDYHQDLQNNAKTLFANIRFASVDNPIKSIVLTSAVPNEGKTRVSLELAKTIASSGQRVLIVEADMRRRSLNSLLERHPRKGGYAVMSGRCDLEDAVVETSVSNLFFLDMEPNIPNPADIISSRAYVRLVEEIDNHFDYAIFDTPPVGTFVDAALLGGLVDGTVLVVRMGTKRDEVVKAYEQLSKSDSNIVGVCANFVEQTSSEYYYEYYYHKGQKAKEDEALKTEPPLRPASMDDINKYSANKYSRNTRRDSAVDRSGSHSAAR